MHVLCVAEKPSIAKSISQILSGGHFQNNAGRSKFNRNFEFDYPQTRSTFTVTSVSGHLTEQDFDEAHRKWSSCSPIDLFDAPIEVVTTKNSKDIERNLIEQARRAAVLMIWTDCDREGEHIGSEIVKACRKGNRNIRVQRARFSAIIPQQIHHAAQYPIELDQAQVDAVDARIQLDLRIGSAFTRLQTLSLQGRFPQLEREDMKSSVISYGPCQFPTLGFVVARWKQVESFVPETFWHIYLALTREIEETRFTWRRNHLFDQDVALAIYEYVLTNSAARVNKVSNKSTKKWKPLPLTTVELQKAGSRLLKMTPKKVLDIAEKLYQGGSVSYPRTETDQFDPDFQLMPLIEKQEADQRWGAFATHLRTGGGFSPPRKGKNNDKAHPPIHPTAYAGNLTGDEKRVYEFITRRFLACCSKDAEGWQTTVDVVCGGEEFYATGLVVLEKNYLEVYIYDKWVGHVVPEFQEGEVFHPSVCELREGRTTAPTLLTEADLVTLMDKNGIGTDATIAQHIQTIVDRGYVIENKEGATRYLRPSDLGMALVEGYDKIGLETSVSKPHLRRETERRMVQVCQGTKTKVEMLAQTIEQYRAMFIISKREFGKVIDCVGRYMGGNGGPGRRPGRPGGNPGGGGGGGGGGGNGGGGGGGDRNGGTGRGTVGGRGRGGASARPHGDRLNRNPSPPPSDDYNDGLSRARGRGRPRKSTEHSDDDDSTLD
ncbi:prokaryotic type I DNA topoisomerase [Fistulina hepatica ATCC 64428]|uniref:DNA topoisomerase n=1 Tax=Fistulina hepatica ATCC 64428 TaxID=1128425 RepID=A0A0D7AMB2_9AGAR|nr:prokaryotic type I DNA topoisomerase [Fistulina hepatica ATCC 64428]